MNNYYPYRQFQQPQPQVPVYTQYQQPIPPPIQSPGQTTLPILEQSYIENILRLNKGRLADVYMDFGSAQWGSKVFRGIIEAAGKDHIILSDPQTDKRYLLLTIYLSYVTFDGEINYEYPFAGIVNIVGQKSQQEQTQQQSQPLQQQFQQPRNKNTKK